MVTAQSHFRRRILLVAGLAVILVAAYLWAIFTAELSLLNMLGLASFFILLICPVLVAFQTVRITLYRDAAPIRDSIQASLSRSASLLLLAALVAIPIAVLFSLYLQIAIAGIFYGINICEGGYDCPPKPAIQPETFIPLTILVLLVVIGLWGLNLLAAVLGAALAQRWRKAMPATSGTILALVVTIAIIYSLLSLTSLPQIPVDLAAAVLPYLLTWGAWHYLAAPAPTPSPAA